MENQTVPILLNLLAALFGAFGQYFYKLGGLRIGGVAIYRNWQLWVGVILFCVVMLLFVWGYKLGGRISVVYPFYATTFVWGSLIGVFLTGESWSLIQSAGIGFVLLGVSLVAAGIGS